CVKIECILIGPDEKWQYAQRNGKPYCHVIDKASQAARQRKHIACKIEPFALKCKVALNSCRK
ncbi:unnamed protein product, partial [Ceratitis capitata]